MHTPQVIGPESKFYGYIVGLHFEPNPDMMSDKVKTGMFVTFEYNGDQTTWEVPDHHLFQILSKYLCDDAVMRGEHGEYGYAKLYIERTAKGWEVDLSS